MTSSRTIKYNRFEAVNYALKYSLHPNKEYRYFPLNDDSSGDCANFLSQCFYAGEIPMNYSVKNPWWYNGNGASNVNWSISWTVAHSLYWYLRVNEHDNLYGLKGTSTNSLNSLEIGDVIFFKDEKNLIFHSAIITSFKNGIPLISQHSFEARNIPYYSSWDAYKTIFLKISF